MYRRQIMFLLNKYVRAYLLILLGTIPLIGVAQQEPQFTQYMFNRLSYNPAYAGSNGAICLTSFYRNQWMGLDLMDVSGGAPSTPQTINFSIDAPVSFLRGGLGATIISDKIGYWNQTFVKLDYAYRFELPTGNLAFGLEAQLFNSTLDRSKLIGSDQYDDLDNIGQSNDPVLSNSSNDDFMFDLGFGVYYQVPGKLYIGLSSAKLLETKSEKLNWEHRRHYYVMAGYDWTVPSNPSLRVLPSVLIKTEFSSMQVDASCLLEYQHKFWGGMNYRLQDAISVMGGLSVGGFKFGLAYDLPTSRLSTQGVGSLDIFVRYCFKVENPPKPPTSYRNTRRN